MSPSREQTPGTGAAVLLAGGRGSRMGNDVPDKILYPIRGRPLFRFAFDAFADSAEIRDIIVVYRDAAQRDAMLAAAGDSAAARYGRIHWVAGGTERADSVWAGLEQVPEEADLVFIHDLARPLIRTADLTELARLARREGAVCPVRRITDTIKQAHPAVSTRSADSGTAHLIGVPREQLRATETPQVFRRELIVTGYHRARSERLTLSDDTAAVALLHQPVAMLELAHPNPKVTRPEDLDYVAFLLARTEEAD